ncbi:Las1-domain-containing protein [Lactarius akahatsu]|uniref:Las1-domain-containing protein n=1 Tax=Lactarius akahatsu TaxID=416441 RepID=A0AAD4QB07_9AGAM|nr:Las1-domain-containing protein [Lactarius akahatsu]
MRLPRRVPWATLAQLEQVYSWVYSQDAGDSSRDSAIERLSAWKFMMPLPHALESLLSILVTIRQESTYNAGVSSSLSLRQSYATAIIRLVNGLVDPLQLGTYARSISSIAAQIGLPAWLVELRHAATHEDLPSLELLRDGVKECLTWLLHNYFRPTLDPTLAHAAPQIRHSLRPAEPLLRRYKGLLKSLARDDDAARRHNADVRAVLRELERWLAEARIAGANAHADADDGDEPREAWALDRLCEALLARGALVPLSRKKRAPPEGSRYPPPALLAIWTPLLENLAVGPLRTALSSHIVARLLVEHNHDACPDDDDDDERASYELCLAAWGAWLVEEWRLADESDADVSARREDVFFQLVHALCTSCRDKATTGAPLACCQPGAQALLAALCASDRRLAEISATVLRRANNATGAAAQVSVQQGDEPWNETDLDIMDARLRAAFSLADAPERQPQEQIQCSPAPEPGPGGRGSSASNKEIVPLRDGWRLLTETDGWRPCPIGIYIEGR